MLVYRRLPRRPLKLRGAVAAIGVFDGVHRGHRRILRAAVARARARGGTPIAITFHPHPLRILRPAAAPPLLMPLERRLEAIAGCGIRAALVIPFTRRFSRWSAERFARELLAGRLGVKEVVVGYNFRFGADRAGSVRTLRDLGSRWGFKARAVGPVRTGRRRISSAAIRGLVRAGRVREAALFLGRPFCVAGRVVRGSGRGRAIGFATANVKSAAELLPPVGVYAVRARIGGWGRRLAGMANLGYRPTFARVRPSAPLLEAHLFGLRRPLYGRRLEVEFLRRFRGERRFPSAAALASQLARDAARARKEA